MKICQTTWRQRRAPSCELEECFPFHSCHTNQHIHKFDEARGLLGVAQLWFSILDYLFPSK